VVSPVFSRQAVNDCSPKPPNLPPPSVRSASHGKTIRPRPSGAAPFTLQIRDPNVIAALTASGRGGFRRKDMALAARRALGAGFHEAGNFGAPGKIAWCSTSGIAT